MLKSKNIWKDFVAYAKNLNAAYIAKVIAKEPSINNVKKKFKNKDSPISTIFLPNYKSNNYAWKIRTSSKYLTWVIYARTANLTLYSA